MPAQQRHVGCVFQDLRLFPHLNVAGNLHYGLRRANVISTSAPVATQVPHAAGIALAIKLRHDDCVVLTCLGEGATSQGEWYEALNWAGIHQLPFICLVQNNAYAISEPVDREMAVSRALTAVQKAARQ